MNSSPTSYPEPAVEVIRKNRVSPVGMEHQWRSPGDADADAPQPGGWKSRIRAASRTIASR